MSEKEVIFCERYEAKMNEFRLLRTVESDLTDTGRQAYRKIKKWLGENLCKYLEIKQV